MTGRPLAIRAGTGDPAVDLAAEEDLLDRAASGAPGLLLTSWTGPVVVLGHGQPASDVDGAWCAARGIPVLRRLSGGTGVVHAGDLGVSLALPAAHPWARGIHAAYDAFLDVVQAVLIGAGVTVVRAPAPTPGIRARSPVCFEDVAWETLLVEGRKAVGCAQVRRARASLVHGVLAFDPHVALYAGTFRADPVRLGERLGALPVPPAARSRLVEALAAAFATAVDAATAAG